MTTSATEQLEIVMDPIVDVTTAPAGSTQLTPSEIKHFALLEAVQQKCQLKAMKTGAKAMSKGALTKAIATECELTQKECAEGGYAAKHRSRQDHAAKAKPALTEEEKAARREKRRRAAAEAEGVDCTHCTAHSACMCGRVREIEAGCDCAGS